MKLITGAVALAAALTIALAPLAAADAPDGKGVPHSTETHSTSKPTNPRGFGSITSQRALDPLHDIGSHASKQNRPHLGVGNVSRNDQADGTRPGDHAALVGPLAHYDPNNRPGTHEDETTAANESTNTSAPTTLATPAANDPSFSLGPLGTFSFSNSFTSLTDYSYNFGLSGGPVEYEVRSEGTDAGVTGFSSYSAGGFSTSTDSAYGTSYEGSSCVLCQENTTSFGDFSQITEFNVLGDGTLEYEGSNPFGSYSWPPE